MRKVVGFLLALSAFYVASLYTFTRMPPTAGPLMARLIRAQANARGPFPQVGTTYSWKDNRNGVTYSAKVLIVGQTYKAGLGYAPCAPEPMRCVDDSDLPSCEIGVDAAVCDGSGNRVDYVTPSHRARLAEFAVHGDILPATITTRRASWIKQNDAMAIIGDTGGGPNTPPQSTLIDMTLMPDGTWMMDFEDGIGDYWSVVVGPGGAT